MTSRFGNALVWLGLGIGLLALGCGSEKDVGPPTYPVKGQIIVKNGDVKPLVGGFVRLVSIADSKIIGMGEIQDDGTFGVGTFVDGKPRGGLPEGEYRARVEPPESEEQNSDDQPPRSRKGSLLPKYQTYETSGLKYAIKPGENTITVEVEARR